MRSWRKTSHRFVPQFTPDQASARSRPSLSAVATAVSRAPVPLFAEYDETRSFLPPKGPPRNVFNRTGWQTGSPCPFSARVNSVLQPPGRPMVLLYFLSFTQEVEHMLVERSEMRRATEERRELVSGPGSYQRRRSLARELRISLLVAALVVLCSATSKAATCNYYASPTGTGNGLSASSPFQVSKFWPVATAGKTLCLLDGTYTGCASMILPPWGLNGASGLPITIRALNDGKVLIMGRAANRPVWLQYNDWFVIEGINACCSKTTVVDLEHSNNNVIRRVAAWDAADGNTEHLRSALWLLQSARRRRRLGHGAQDLLGVPGRRLPDRQARLGPLGEVYGRRTQNHLLARLQQLPHDLRELPGHLERPGHAPDLCPDGLLRQALDGSGCRHLQQLCRASAVRNFLCLR